MQRYSKGLPIIELSVAHDFKLINKKVTSEQFRTDPAYHNAVLDSRLNIVSVNTPGGDIFHKFLNYMYLMVTVNNNQAATATRSRYTTLLDLGYVPVVTPPCVSGEEELHSRAIVMSIGGKLSELGIPFLYKTTMCPDGRFVSSVFTDIWVHRMDMSKVLGCDPMEVHICDFIKKVVSSK